MECGKAARRHRVGGIGWALATALCLLAPVSPALPQETQPPSATGDAATQAIAFQIPAGTLDAAIASLGRQARLQIVYDPAIAAGAHSPGLSATMTATEALGRLLSGTGIIYRFTDAAIVALQRQDSGVMTLDPVIAVERSQTEEPGTHVEGYVADNGTSATKTNTPLIETPQSVSVITSDQMKAQGAKEVGDVLRYTAGVTGEPYGPDVRGIFFQFRGFNVADEAFFRDGMLNRGSDFAGFASLDPYGAERYEVLRGPASVLYGQISPGGLLNYVTKRPPQEEFGEALVEGGSFARLGASFDLGGPVTEDGEFLYRLTGHGHFSDTQVDFVEQERAYFAPAVTWQPDDDTSLTFLANVQYDKTGWANQFLPPSGTVLPNPIGEIPRSRFTGEPGFDNYEQTQESLSYLFEHRFDEIFTLRHNSRVAHLSNTQQGVFGLGLQADGRTFDRYGDSGESSMLTITSDTQLETRLSTGAAQHTLLLGLDVLYNNYKDLGLEYEVDPIDIFNPSYGSPITLIGPYYDADIKQRQIGLYLQDQLKIGGLSIVAGGRHDWSSIGTVERVEGVDDVQNDSALSGRIGLIYGFDNGLAPYASYATSFTPLVGTDAEGEPFDPETGEQYEIGLKYQPPGFDSFVTVSVFDLRQKNVQTTDPNDDRFLVQTGEVRSRGFEFEGVASFDFGLDLIAAYSFVDAEVTESNDGFKGLTPYGIPHHRASLWADYTIPDGQFAGFGGGIGARYVGETYGDDANTFKVPASTVFDATIHYDYDPFTFAVTASNLFDNKYVASCYTAGAGCFYGERLEVIGTVAYRW